MRISKNKLFKHISFTEIDCHALSLYLEEMASNGWLLYDVFAGIFKFKKSNPQKINFSIDIFDKTTNPVKDYFEICKAAGWEHICSYSKYQIFCTKDQGTTPIQTDLKFEFKNIANNILLLITMTTLCFSLPMLYDSNESIQYIINNIDNMNKYKTILFISLTIVLLVICLESLIEIIINVTWFYKSKKSLKDTNELKYISLKSFKKKLHVSNYTGIYYVLNLILIALIIIIPVNYYSFIIVYPYILSIILAIAVSVMSIIYCIKTLKEI